MNAKITRRLLAVLLTIAMMLTLLPTAFAAEVKFSDVKEGDWFYASVQYCVDNDLLAGDPDGSFRPSDKLTRAEMATILWRLAGKPETPAYQGTFKDVGKNDWFQPYVEWAAKAGVAKGNDDGTFGPNDNVTREQLATFLYRFAKDYMKQDVSASTDLSSYPDSTTISSYAVDAMKWAAAEGIMKGSKEGNKVLILPKANALRCEVAAMTARFNDTVLGVHVWDEGKVTKEATCTEAGVKTYTCTMCGETKTEEIAALGHNYENGVCANCGDKLADDGEIVIYYTNDVHTYIDNALSYDNIADLKKQTASVAAGTLLLDAGDHVQGTAYGAMDKGATIIKLMNAAGYDAATLGNHEFDYGMARALELVGEANFPYLSCNFYRCENEENVLNAYKIFEVGGKKIAVIGITTPETITKSTPAYFMNEDQTEWLYGIDADSETDGDGLGLYATVQDSIDSAKEAGADYVIALGHLGVDPSSGNYTSEKVIANTTGLDAFIDGHSHSTVEMEEVDDAEGNKVVLTQTGSYFDAIGRMSITADGIKTELITDYTGSDAATKAIKDDWMKQVDDMLGEKIATNNVDLRIKNDEGTRLIRSQETNLGDFTADALYYLFNETEGLDCDLAVMNGGGIRADLPKGDVTYKSCKTVHTFGNVACLMTVTGQQIIDALEWGAKDVGVGENGGFLQVSGVTYEIHSYIPSTVQQESKIWTGAPTGDYRVQNVKIYDKDLGEYVPIDPEAKYNLAGYNYTLRDMGDGFNMFDGAELVKDYVMEDYLVLANYAKSFPDATIEATNSVLGSDYTDINGEGRIKIVSEKPVDPEPTDDFVLASEIKDGDEVVIYNPGHGMAIKNETDNDWYLMPETVTPTDNKIVAPDASLVWTVVDNGNGTFSFVNGENKIMMWLSESNGKTYFELTNNANYEGATGEWKVISADASQSLYYIQHSTLSNSYGPAYIECYYNANKDTTKISGYSSSNPTANDFGFQFYVKGAEAACAHEWDEGEVTTEATCTTAGVKTYTCALCGETKTEEIAALGHIDENSDNICDRCGADLGTGTATEFVLASELKEGDEVVIVCAAKNVALGNTYNGYYNNAIAVTPENGKLVDPSADVVWTVGKEGEFYTFSFNGQKIAMGTGFTSMPLGEVNYKWQLQDAATEGAFYLANLDREAGKEYRMQYQEAKGTWSAYHTIAEGAEEFFALNFYVKGGEAACAHEWDEGEVTTEATCTSAGVKTFTCALCGETKTEEIAALGHIDENSDNICDRCGAELGVSSDDFVLASELKDGDEVIIVCAAKNIAFSSEKYPQKDFYNAGVAVTPVDGKITDAPAAIVWTVGKDGENYTFSFNGQKIGMGEQYSSTDLGAVNDTWAIETAKTDGAFYLKNLGRNLWLEWYESNNYWSCYKDNSNEALFALNFYVKGGVAACTHEWDEGKVTTEATCTTAGVKTFTCAKCGETKTEEIAALGHIDENSDNICDRCEADLTPSDYAIADSLAVGDKIVITVSYDGKNYAAANDTTTVNNALYAEEVTVSGSSLIIPEGKDVEWEVCAGSTEGTFTLKSSDGKYIYNASGTGVSLQDAGVDLTITCGKDTSALLLTSTATASTVRELFLRMNNAVPQFRFYSTANSVTAGYSSVLTIWKG